MKTAIGIILLAIIISLFVYVCMVIANIHSENQKKEYQRKRNNQYKKIDPSKVWHREGEFWSKN